MIKRQLSRGWNPTPYIVLVSFRVITPNIVENCGNILTLQCSRTLHSFLYGYFWWWKIFRWKKFQPGMKLLFSQIFILELNRYNFSRLSFWKFIQINLGHMDYSNVSSKRIKWKMSWINFSLTCPYRARYATHSLIRWRKYFLSFLQNNGQIKLLFRWIIYFILYYLCFTKKCLNSNSIITVSLSDSISLQCYSLSITHMWKWS